MDEADVLAQAANRYHHRKIYRRNLFENLLENRLFIRIIPAIMRIQALFVAYGGEVLRSVGLTAQEWVYVLLMAFVIIPADLLRKAVRNHWLGNPVMQEAP